VWDDRSGSTPHEAYLRNIVEVLSLLPCGLSVCSHLFEERSQSRRRFDMNRAAYILPAIALLLLPSMGLAADPPVARPTRPPLPESKSVGPGRPLPLLEVDEESITVRLPGDADDGDPEERTLRTDPKRTRVWFVESKERQLTERGTFRVVVKRRPGTLAELKAGQRVVVMEQDGLATSIQVELPEEDQSAP
jgi:hypothetical protein